MSPIPALNMNLSSIMPNADLASSAATALPDAATLPTGSIQMPSELSSANFPTSSGNSFSSMFSQMVSEVNAQQSTAAQSVSALQSGQPVPLHKAVIAMEEANVSFQLMVEVRNRLLDGYQEIMRMQI